MCTFVICVRFCNKDFNELNNDLNTTVVLCWGAQYILCVFLFYELSIMYKFVLHPMKYFVLFFIMRSYRKVLKHTKHTINMHRQLILNYQIYAEKLTIKVIDTRYIYHMQSKMCLKGKYAYCKMNILCRHLIWLGN